MSNEIKIDYGITAASLYALVLNASGQIYNGSTFETPAAASWGNYDITLAEQSTTGIYLGTFPVIAAGIYGISARVRAGASPATTDAVVGSGQMNWGGTAEIVPFNVGTDVVSANLTQILGTVLTETAGYLAAAFKKFFNVSPPVATVATAWLSTDPLANAVPGAYAAGTAGAALGKISGTPTVTDNVAQSGLATIRRGDTWTGTFTGLGSIAGWSKLWFTVRENKDDADTVSTLQVVLSSPAVGTDGLLYLSGAVTTAAWGIIAVTSAPNGDLTITILSNATKDLASQSGLNYDIQVLIGANPKTIAEGLCNIASGMPFLYFNNL